MRNKVTCLLTCLVLILSLVACGSGSSLASSSADNNASSATDNTESVSVSFSWWGNQIRSSGTLDCLKDYEENTAGVTVAENLAEWSDYWSGLATCAAGHILPDVIQMDYYYLRQFDEKNLLMNLYPLAKEGQIDFSSQLQHMPDEWRVKGKLLGITGGVSAPALIYNKSLLDSLGITVKDRMTTAEFIGIARRVFEETGVRTNIAFGVEGFQEYFCRGYDELLYQENDSGVSRKTLEKYYGLYQQARSEGWLIDPGAFSDISIGSVEQDPMIRGSSPEMTSWCDFAYSYQMYAIRKAAPANMELGIAAWPSDHPEKSIYLRPGPALSVTTDSANPLEAARLIEYVTDPEIQLSVIHGERGIPYSLLTGEKEISVTDESNRMVLRYLKEVVMPVASQINPPTPGWAVQAYNLNGRLVEEICYGECDAGKAAEEFLQGCRDLCD